MLELDKINFGACDSETEATLESGSYLPSVYFDPFNTLENLERGKFIVAGRKGTGKSGFAYQLTLSPNANRFIRVLKYKHFELRALVEMAGQTVNDASRYALWKWILLCTLFEEMSDDNSIELSAQARHDLMTARKRITEFASLDGMKIEETLKKTKGQVSIAAFKSVASASNSNSFETRETQVSILDLNHRLQNLLKDLFALKRDVANAYVVCIDDLDEGFDGSDEHKRNLVSLIKAAKDLFTEFGTCGVKFYPVILIRLDILESLNTIDSSFNKIISSNTLMYNWYRQSLAYLDPEQIPLRRLIKQRIDHAYRMHSQTAPPDAVTGILSEAFVDSKDPFKQLLQITLFRPRDLIQFFGSLAAASPGRTTVSRDTYLRVYRNEFIPFVIREWENELMAFLTASEIKVIVAACKNIEGDTFTKDQFKERLARFSIKKAVEEVLSRLYQAGMISNVRSDSEGKRIYNWIYRSENAEDDHVDFDLPFIVHPCLRESARKKGLFR